MSSPLAATVKATTGEMRDEFVGVLKSEHPDWETNPEIKALIDEIEQIFTKPNPELQNALDKEQQAQNLYLDVLTANANGHILENIPEEYYYLNRSMQLHNIQSHAFNREMALADSALPMLVLVNEINELPIIEAASAYEVLPSAAVRVYENLYPTNLIADVPAPAHLARIPEGQLFQAVADFILTPR